MDGLTPADCADTKEIDAMVPELISLRERIARLEAREAELQARLETLERSRRALLGHAEKVRRLICGKFIAQTGL